MNHIVLDIDETLIYTLLLSRAREIPEYLHRESYIIVDGTITVLRPYVKDFLFYCFNNFKSVSIYSAGSDEYVSTISNFLLRYVNGIPSRGYSFLFVYSYKRCQKKLKDMINEFHATYYIQKPLCKMWKTAKAKKIGMNKYNTIIIDDKEEYCKCNYGNALYIVPFDINRKDNYLLYIMKYLEEYIIYSQNIRSIDKRNWFL